VMDGRAIAYSALSIYAICCHVLKSGGMVDFKNDANWKLEILAFLQI